MPKFPTIPRLTIVVPYAGDSDSFENTLVSVLQHRPDGCEVIVPHAGNYDDPFDLGDEVRFVNAASTSFTQQIGEAAAVAHGRFVHVVSDGYRATSDWVDAALTQFEHHDTGIVVPVVRDHGSSEIVHAGWCRSASAACELIAAGDDKISSPDNRRIEGGFLSASFWRRDLLRSLTGSFRTSSVVEASMVYGLLARQAGWRCVTSDDCTLQFADSEAMVGEYQSEIDRNHRRLQAIADQFGDGGWGKSFGRLISTCFFAGIGSAVRRATAPLAESSIASSLRSDGVLRCDEQDEAIRIPVTSRTQLRRAA